MKLATGEVSDDGTATVVFPLIWRVKGYPQRSLGGSGA
jgi:hypothetical protein